MFAPDQYQLLDFGEARKLERFGPHVIQRPCPAAETLPVARPELWLEPHAGYRRGSGSRGSWQPAGILPAAWTIRHDRWSLELRPTPFGHLGVFPEQAANWDWLSRTIRQAGRPLKLLNLFAYTGGSTLAAAAAGAEVVHVDAARNVLAWARRNAHLSGLDSAPIRWISEDARKFVAREIRRNNAYDGVILDPPSYGHGPRGPAWNLQRDLWPLLEACAALTARRRGLLLLTCHTTGLSARELESRLAAGFFGATRPTVRVRPLGLTSVDGRVLYGGMVARWAGELWES